MPLPPFRFENTVSSESAKQDHLHITLDSWTLRGTTEDIDGFLRRMGAPPESIREGSCELIMSGWGRLFNRPQLCGNIRRPLSIRQEPLNIGGELVPPPLFSGSWKLNYYVHDDSTERPIRSKLQLHLNPTRFVRYQCPVPMPDPARRGHWPEPQLYAFRGEAEIGGERVLDGNDNWLPQSARWVAFTNPARWKRHLVKYLNAVACELTREIIRINLALDVPISWQPTSHRFNLHTAETYWEFASENPQALVASLEPLFRSFSARQCQAVGFLGVSGDEYLNNALCLKAEIGGGRGIRIYAKTNKRIRVEVIHSMRGPNGFALEGGHTGEWEELPVRLETLAQDAADLVNRLLAHFRGQCALTSCHVVPFHLLLQITHHSRDFVVALTIANALIYLGRVSSREAGQKMRRALHRLSGDGVLEYNPRTGIYVPTAPYRHALEALKRNGNCSLLTARVRRRTRS